MHKGELVQLKVPMHYGTPDEYTTQIATYLGCGMFSTAFRHDDAALLYTVACSGKEIHRHAKDALTDNPHLPYVTGVGSLCWNRHYDCYVWRMPYYHHLRASHKEAWQQAKAIIKASDDAFNMWHRMEGIKTWDTTDFTGLRMEVLKQLSGKVPNLLFEAMQALVYAMDDYGEHFAFDMKSTAFSVDDDSQLVLRDMVFDRKLFTDIRYNRQKLNAIRGNRPWKEMSK